jgi:hypothetical protein
MSDEDPLFDYSSIMLKMDRLNREIHDCLLDGDYAKSAALAQELLLQTRYLQLWIKREMEADG